jgi:hypothetical protein
MPSPHSTRARAILVAALGIFSVGPASAMCTNQGMELIQHLNGAWRGRGTVQPIGGAPERIACRITYSSEGSDRIRQNIECAGTDYKFAASSQVTCAGNTVVGSFEEKVANNTGSVKGFIDGSNLKIEAESPNFKGHFNVKFLSETNHSVQITQFDPALGRQSVVASLQLTR